MGAIKKPPPKPMWEDVSALPRIPKIKRAAEADENRSRGSRLPDSCVSNLAGTRGRQQAVEQGSSRSEQERVEGGGKPGQDGAGTSSGLSHSSSFSSSSSGSAVTPGGSSSSSSSSTVSFRINASANSWHARRLAGIGSFSNPLEVARDDSWKKRLKSKQLLLSSMRSQSKDTAVKAEVYDPFDPTGSDSAESDSAPEMENAGSATQFPELAIPQGKKPSVSELASQGSNTEGTSHCIKAETLQGDPMEIDGEQMDIDNSSDEEGKQLLERLEVKKEPKDVKEEEELGSVAKDEVEVPEDMVVKEELEGPELSVMMGCGQTTTKPEALSPQLPSEGQNDKATKGCEEVNPDPRQNTLPSKSSRFRSRSRSSSASSHREEKSVKPEQKRPSRNHHSRSKSRSRSRSRSSADRKRVSGRRKRSKERRSSSGSPDGRRRKTEAGGRSQVKRTRRSRSKERRKTRSPSDSSHSEGSERSRRNRRRSRSRDRRRSRSSSEERSRRRKHRRDSRERYSRKERKRSKESKDRRRGRSWSRSKSRSRSRSRSLSRSRDRRKDRKWSQSSSRSKDRARSRSKERRRARSRSRERRTEGRSSQSSRSPAIRSSQKTARSSASDPKNARDTKEIRKEKIVSPSAIKLESKPEQEPGAVKAERPSLVKDTELKVIKVETTVSLSAVKDDDFSETEIKRTVSFSSMKKEEDLKETNNKIIVSNSEAEEQQRNGEDAKNAKPFPLVLVKEENEPEEVSRENLVPLAPVKAESRPADCEERLASVRCEEGEHFTTLEGENKDEKTDQKKDTMEVVLKTAELPEIECKMEPSLPEPAAQSPCISIKREPSPDLESCPQWVSSGSASLNAIAIEYEEEGEEVALPSKADVLKQEKEELSTDEDFNVDYILDCLDSVRNKKAETAGERQSEKGAAAVDASVDKTDTPPAAVAPETEPVPVTANAKPKPAGKRVTWNLQDADQPSAEKTGKIPLHKMKQSQKEGSRKSAALSLPSEQKQEFAQPAAVPSGDPTAPGAMATAPSAGPSGSQVQADVQDPTTAGSKKEGETQDPSRTDKYMKKLHMQERAVEEVKLAIKPFYQKRTITKEEYKDILRKAVQKVCHSKSGEINPVKVANLVKAYVDKYRHARKHKKDDGGKSQEDEKTKDSDTP
ncbi:hypothetical protein GJAV_G00232190 [Gymnothorax javanicus]|nr:hypothetical protein GJAV_G00232190 [Gymnothorax javanicus]